MRIDINNVGEVDFAKSPLMPAIIQDIHTGQVLMQGFMDSAALKHTLNTKKVTFYSRSKQRLWTKGESSGHFLHVERIDTDCDKDSLLILATPKGPTCHTGTQSCFDDAKPHLGFLGELENIIIERKDADPESSYTASLFAKDLSRSCQKVGEEGVEVALAAMKNDNNELLNESADLLYHLIVLLQRQGLSLSEVVRTLAARH